MEGRPGEGYVTRGGDFRRKPDPQQLYKDNQELLEENFQLSQTVYALRDQFFFLGSYCLKLDHNLSEEERLQRIENRLRRLATMISELFSEDQMVPVEAVKVSHPPEKWRDVTPFYLGLKHRITTLEEKNRRLEKTVKVISHSKRHVLQDVYEALLDFMRHAGAALENSPEYVRLLAAIGNYKIPAPTIFSDADMYDVERDDKDEITGTGHALF